MNVKKTERDGIVRAYPENGKPLAWSASSGVELIEKAVSYTHLDVYKRQALVRAMCRNGWIA